MATVRWRGDAPAVAQVQAWLLGGTLEATDLVSVTINGKRVQLAAGATSIPAIVDNIVAALASLPPTIYPEFAEIAWSRSGDSLVATANEAGVPLAVALATTETDGSPPDSQTVDGAASSVGSTLVAATGPNFWDEPANWSTGALPADGDDVFLGDSESSVLYGLDQSGLQLASLTIEQSFAGTVGLPRTHALGYVEFRPQYLRLGATVVRMGTGQGAGSGRIKLDLGSEQTSCTVRDTGNPLESGVPAVLLLGTHVANQVDIYRGSVGVAFFPGEVATVAMLRIGYRDNVAADASVRCGTGAALTAIDKSGGELETQSDITGAAQADGTWTHEAGTIATLDLRGGTCFYNSTGTLSAAHVSGEATLDFSRDLRAKTVSSCHRYGTARIRDPFQVVDFSTGIDCQQTDLANLELGTHLKITRGAVS